MISARRATRERLWTPGPAAESVAARAPASLLPQRAPFLFVDALDRLDREKRTLTARRRIAADDPVLAAHTLGEPVYPGTLQIETMAQAALALVFLLREAVTNVRLTRVFEATFLRAVRPGAVLEIVCELESLDDLRALGVAQLLEGSEIVAGCALEVCFVD